MTDPQERATCAWPECEQVAAPGRAFCDEHPPGRKITATSGGAPKCRDARCDRDVAMPGEPCDEHTGPRPHEKVAAPPRVERFERTLRAVRQHIDEMLDDSQRCPEYRWPHAAAHAPLSGDGEARGNGPADSTSSAVAGEYQGKVRADLRTAMTAATNSLREMVFCREGLRLANKRDPGGEPVDVASGPPLISNAELARAQAAQKRRHSRGEGFGEA